MNCVVHAERDAVAGCSSCGQWVCYGCDVLVAGQHHCRACLAAAVPATYPARRSDLKPLARQPLPLQLFRSRNDRMLAGVCGGLAQYCGLDAMLIRFLMALAACTGVGIVIYAIAWIFVPVEYIF